MALPIPFDNPATYDGHSGVDYPQPRGAVIRASGPGTVTTLSRNARGGFYIWVQYDEGPLVGYHHMDSHAGCPPRWSRVREGTQLGYVGNSGYSTGPHLHSEVSGHASTAGYWRFFDPRRVVGHGGGNITPATGGASTPIQSEEDDMAQNSGIYWKATDGRQMNAVVNAGSGFFQTFESNDGEYNSGIARAFDTGSFELVSESHARAIEGACAAVRAG